jgi:hypothetical protein
MVPRSLVVFCLMVAVHTLSLAQAPVSTFPTEKTIRSWLASGDLKMVAWGAYDAAAAHDRKLVPDLLSLAANWQDFPTIDDDGNPVALSHLQKDQRDAMAAVVDALIQLHAAVPSETLRTLAPNFGNEVAVLLSRMPSDEAQPPALDFYHSVKPTPLQYVSASLLALNPPAGFAADMLSNVTIRAAVYVLSPGMERSYGGGGGSCFTETPAPREGWPRIAQYVLSGDKTKGSFVVVAGIDFIYATREESVHYSDGCRTAFGVYLTPDERLRLIAEMLGVDPASIPWNATPETTVVFKSPEQYEGAVLDFARGEQKKYHATVAALAERGLISPLEAENSEILPTLQLRVIDMRKDAPPLPELASLPPRVEVHGPIF